MVKTVMSSMTMAMVAADDVSLLQVSAGVRQSQGQRILAAVAKQDKDAICLQASAGDVAPVTGSFTARMSQQAVEVAAGSVAGESGSFCVAKQDVLLIQRTFGLNTARDFEAALGSKNNATTATMDHATFDFEGDLTKVVTVKAGDCPSVEAGLVQTVEASVSDKQQEMAEKKLDADQLRVCKCRNFMKSTTVNAKTALPVGEITDPPKLNQEMANREVASWALLSKMLGELGSEAAKAVAVADPKAAVLLERNFDTALARKKTAPTIDHNLTAEFRLVEACASAWAFPGSWTQVAKEVNNPKYVTLFKSFNITGGWEHCDQSWVVQGACGEFVPALTVATKYDQATGVQVPKCTDTPFMEGGTFAGHLTGQAPDSLPGCTNNDSPWTDPYSCRSGTGLKSCLAPGGGAHGGKVGTVLELNLCCKHV